MNGQLGPATYFVASRSYPISIPYPPRNRALDENLQKRELREMEDDLETLNTAIQAFKESAQEFIVGKSRDNLLLRATYVCLAFVTRPLCPNLLAADDDICDYFAGLGFGRDVLRGTSG